MKQLFLSHRADDSAHVTTAISDELMRHFGQVNVVRDSTGAFGPGHIRRALERSDVVVVVIGPHWLDARDSHGHRQIDNYQDSVRTELRTAFERGIPVIPVLLGQTSLPAENELPSDLRLLTRSTPWQIRPKTMTSDVRGLIEKLDPAAAAPRPSNIQNNSATHGGNVYASQGGNQTITVHTTNGNPR